MLEIASSKSQIIFCLSKCLRVAFPIFHVPTLRRCMSACECIYLHVCECEGACVSVRVRVGVPVRVGVRVGVRVCVNV